MLAQKGRSTTRPHSPAMFRAVSSHTRFRRPLLPPKLWYRSSITTPSLQKSLRIYNKAIQCADRLYRESCTSVIKWIGQLATEVIKQRMLDFTMLNLAIMRSRQGHGLTRFGVEVEKHTSPIVITFGHRKRRKTSL